MSIHGLRRMNRSSERAIILNEVTKLIDELRADMVNSKDEMQRLFHELRADMVTSKEETNQRIDELSAGLNTSKEETNQQTAESKRTYLFQKEPSGSVNVWSIRNIFTVTYLDGLRELADANLNWILRAVWSLILFINLLLLVYGMIPLVKDYLEEVTITKAHQIKTNITQLNQPSICLNLFEKLLYLRRGNGSNYDLHPVNNESLLYLGYIKAMMPLFANSGLWLSHIPSGNLTWSEFESLPARSSFSLSYEEAALLSQNALYDSLYSWGTGQTNLTTSEHSKFHYVTKFHSEILAETPESAEYLKGDGRICLPINLSQERWTAADGKEAKNFMYQHYASAERTNLTLVPQASLSSLHFNAKIYPLSIPYPSSFLESVYHYKIDTLVYLVVPTKYIHLNLTRQPCYDAFGEIYPRGFGETVCFYDCLWKNQALSFNCSFWEDANPDEQQGINVCHVFDIFHQLRSNMSRMCKNDQTKLWCNDQTMRSVEGWNQLLMRTFRELVVEKASSIGDCQSKCANFKFCEEWELKYESLYKHDEVKFMDDTVDPNLHSGLTACRTYLISPFISVNEDVLKASREEFMSNLGGIMGLYFGASLCGYFHLLLFLLISCCRKIIKMANK